MILGLNIIAAVSDNADATLLSNNWLSIKGQVKETGISLPCNVRLYEKISGRLMFEVLTDESGFFEFDHLTKTKFFLVAHHHLNQYNAVIQDNVVPK